MSSIIEIRNVSKRYETKDGEVQALRNINLSIEKGEIYGIIGMSGAGKSTLVRCLNLLEKPTEGQILIEGEELLGLREKELRKKRREIAMIFQHFNLLMQKNVVDNIAFPLITAGCKKSEARKKARELLKIVDLQDKEKSYPIQLSGGQKQRVAIARALAVNPKILLCDEATSALDPQTTKSILELLKQINEQYGITIVIITHEMSVVRQICTHVGIIGNGELVESGTVLEIFSHPQTKEARKLIFKGDNQNASASVFGKEVEQIRTGRCIRIVFSENSSFEPVIANMIMKFASPVNILRANTTDVSGTAHGEMILGLPENGDVGNLMIAYLKERGLAVEEVKDYVG